MTPLYLLPCKDAIEKLFYTRRLTDKENNILTVAIVGAVFMMSVFVTNIADVITVIGATTNTAVGFCLPMIFYIKLDKEVNSSWSMKSVSAHVINISFIMFSIWSLTVFFQTKLS